MKIQVLGSCCFSCQKLEGNAKKAVKELRLKDTQVEHIYDFVAGVFMYFPTLVEVPMAKMFLGLGMAKGPLLAYLLADPVISLPSILVVRRIMGTKRTLAYIVLITLFCTLSGLIYGLFAK